MINSVVAIAAAASGALAHLPLQEGPNGLDSTHSEPLKVDTPCRHDQEHAIYGTLENRKDVDIYELVVPEDSPDFFMHVALPVLPFDRSLVKKYGATEDEENLFRKENPFKLEDYPSCPGNEARPIIAVVGPGLVNDVGSGASSRWSTTQNNGCGTDEDRLPFYVADDEGVVLVDFDAKYPYFEDFESGFTIIGEKKFVDLKKGTYKFYVWDKYGRSGDYLAIFGKNEDCYQDGRGYGPVGQACNWLVLPEFHENCGARPEIPGCCCFIPVGTGVCPDDREVLDEFCKNGFKVGGRPLPFLENGAVDLTSGPSGPVTPVEESSAEKPTQPTISVVECVDKFAGNPFANCEDLKRDTGCDEVFSNPFANFLVSDECQKTCGRC